VFYVEWWLWLLWLLFSAGSFGVLEAIAYHNAKLGDTLSETVWRFFIRGGRLKRALFSIAWISFVFWLSTHFISGGYI